MTRYDAKVECIVNRPFLHYGIKYEKGDIFPVNPNNIIHKGWLRAKKIYQLPEENYEYVCTRQHKELLGEIYTFGQIVDLSVLPENQKFLYVKRGYVKKVIKKAEKEEIISYSVFSKNNGVSYKELKELFKEKYGEDLPHHMTAISKEHLEKLEIIISSKQEQE
jgi:hypothetical protein